MADPVEPKRRLEEILPTPVRMDGKSAAGPSPRTRVVSHFRKLAMGTVGLATLGCTGFGVVDPIPPPSRCPQLPQPPKATAQYITNAGSLAIQLTFTPSGIAGDTKFQAGATVSGANKLNENLDQGTGVLTLQLAPSTPTADIQIIVQSNCQGTYGAFTLMLKASASAKAGDPVTVTLTAE